MNIQPNTAYCYKQIAFKRVRGERKKKEFVYRVEITPSKDGTWWNWTVTAEHHNGRCMSGEKTEELANRAAYEYIMGQGENTKINNLTKEEDLEYGKQCL